MLKASQLGQAVRGRKSKPILCLFTHLSNIIVLTMVLISYALKFVLYHFYIILMGNVLSVVPMCTSPVRFSRFLVSSAKGSVTYWIQKLVIHSLIFLNKQQMYIVCFKIPDLRFSQNERKEVSVILSHHFSLKKRENMLLASQLVWYNLQLSNLFIIFVAFFNLIRSWWQLEWSDWRAKIQFEIDFRGANQNIISHCRFVHPSNYMTAVVKTHIRKPHCFAFFPFRLLLLFDFWNWCDLKLCLDESPFKLRQALKADE